MNKIFIVIVVLAILLVLWFLFPKQTDDPESSQPITPSKIERIEPSEPEIDEIEIDESLITETESSKPSSTSLNDSDALIKRFFEKVGAGNLIQNIRHEIIRRFVMATYVISQGNIPKQTPFISTKIPRYQAEPLSQDKKIYKPSKANSNRLKPLIQQITQIPPEKFAQIYLENQTLFQQAFDELGTDKLFDKKIKQCIGSNN